MTPIAPIIVDKYYGFQIRSSTRQSASYQYAHVSVTPAALRQSDILALTQVRAAQTLRKSNSSTQVLDRVLHVARARSEGEYQKLLKEWHGLFRYTVHQAADSRVQPGRLARRSARVDIREARRVYRLVSVDRRRRCINTHLPTISQPNLTELVSQYSRGSRFIGSRAPGPQHLSGSTTSSHELAKRSVSPRRPFPSACPSSPRNLSSSRKCAFRPLFSLAIVRLMTDGVRETVCCVLKEISCSSRSTRSADTLRRTNSPKHSWVTFGICSASLVRRLASFRGVLAIEKLESTGCQRMAVALII
jgi:hypothetical protein